jgi:glycosyltransferase involved in cell wall biosynthesis
MSVQIAGNSGGHHWEQFTLSRWAPRDWLLNLCNTAPLLRQRQSIFIHDAQVFAIPANFNWRFRLWYRAMLFIAGRRAAGIFTNSAFSKGELCRFTGINEEKIAVIHLGADHMARLDAAMPPEVLSRIPVSPFLLAVSSASPNKNFGAVLTMLAELGNAAPPCVFVGQKYAKVFGGAQLDASRVTELGYVSDETLAALYLRALCLVYPSFYEGFGLPPLEAMSFGTPVIVSNTSSLPEICANAAIYCDPNDPATIARAVAMLQSTPQKVRELNIIGRQRASLFTWKQSAERMLDHLCRTLQTQT